MKTPQFTLHDQNNKPHSLADYLGKWVIVYFYPKDDTPGCIKEACAFRDAYKEYEEKGIVVLGISKDSVASHKKFVDKYNLNFTLLSDPDAKIAEEFGAVGMKQIFGKQYRGIKRMSFLIGPDGEIKKEYPKVKPNQHADEILRDIENLK